MQILIDTNAFHGEWELTSPHARLLLAAARSDEVDVIVPEVVIIETAGMARRELGTAWENHEKARRTLTALGEPIDKLDLDLEAKAAEYEQRLRQKLRENGVSTPQPTNVSHIDLVKRAVARQKPFNQHGGGYRDSLIWLHAVEAAHDDEVVIVTNNHVDFARSKDEPTELADALKHELEAHGLETDVVTIVKTIGDAVRKHIDPSADALIRVRAELADGAIQSQLYEAVNEDLLLREVSNVDDDDLRRLDVRDIQIEGVHELRDVEVDDAYEADGEITFNFRAVVDVEAEFFAFKYEAFSDDELSHLITDWDWNESMTRGSAMVELPIEGFGEFDPAEGTVSARVSIAD